MKTQNGLCRTMARLFDDGPSDNIQRDVAPFTAAPFTTRPAGSNATTGPVTKTSYGWAIKSAQSKNGDYSLSAGPLQLHARAHRFTILRLALIILVIQS